MIRTLPARGGSSRSLARTPTLLAVATGALMLASCSSQPATMESPAPTALEPLRVTAPTPDPRVGLAPGPKGCEIPWVVPGLRPLFSL